MSTVEDPPTSSLPPRPRRSRRRRRGAAAARRPPARPGLRRPPPPRSAAPCLMEAPGRAPGRGRSCLEGLLDPLHLRGQLSGVAGADVGLEHQPDARRDLGDTSTARLTTAITSSHSPSMLVNIALVSLGSPDSRTTRMAAATASVTPPVSSAAAPDGEMLKATSMAPTVIGVRTRGTRPARGRSPCAASSSMQVTPIDSTAQVIVAVRPRRRAASTTRARLADRVGVADRAGPALERLDPTHALGERRRRRRRPG